MIKFTVLGQPVGKGRPRVVRRGNLPYPVAITPDKTRRAEESFLSQALPFKPASPISKPIALTMEFYFQIPKSWSKKKAADALNGAVRPTSKPDIDNAIKLIDALNGVFWVDDSLIVEIAAAKHYSNVPRTVVAIREIDTD